MMRNGLNGWLEMINLGRFPPVLATILKNIYILPICIFFLLICCPSTEVHKVFGFRTLLHVLNY